MRKKIEGSFLFFVQRCGGLPASPSIENNQCLNTPNIKLLLLKFSSLNREESAGQSVILACSALKKMYRRILVSGGDAVYSKSDQLEEQGDSATGKLLFIHLDGSMELIASRLKKRTGHFMSPELLQSQFDTLEPPSAPENFITVSLEKSVSEIVSEIEKSLH